MYIDQPKLPELQQMTFSNYKNSNTFKVLVGISPDGVITFVSALYPGSISDKELTRRSGIMDLLEPGDSVKADRGFDIEDDLILRGVHLNIPPFLRGKEQFSEKELVLVDSADCIFEDSCRESNGADKKFPYYISLTDIADRLFSFVVF